MKASRKFKRAVEAEVKRLTELKESTPEQRKASQVINRAHNRIEIAENAVIASQEEFRDSQRQAQKAGDSFLARGLSKAVDAHEPVKKLLRKANDELFKAIWPRG